MTLGLLSVKPENYGNELHDWEESWFPLVVACRDVSELLQSV